MINIATKSLQKRKSNADGLRVCIMRRINKEYDFDIWLPRLAPSENLLKRYVKNKKISWREFKNKFNKQVIKRNRKFIKYVSTLSQMSKITLLCWEKKPDKCHRRLVAEECRKINPRLKVIFR